ncbi:MAG: hypothetical protein IPK78_09135 [Rhodospirillales bacterium]|nr:hypothetical protein [Rhodospirillales bacterium]
MKRSFEVRVECYAGHGGEQTPRRFASDGRTIDVVEVLDAWLAPDHRYFKIRGNNGACYILRNDVMTGRWELTMFDLTGAIG